MNSTTTLPISTSIPGGAYQEHQFSLNFLYSIIQSFSLIVIAELGDKTFIMLIILQLKTNKITVLMSSLLTQLFLNLLACSIGYAVDFMLYKNFIDYIGIVYFFIYGLWLLGNSLQSSNLSFEGELNLSLSETKKEAVMKKQKSDLSKKLTVIPEMIREDSKTEIDNNNKKTFPGESSAKYDNLIKSQTHNEQLKTPLIDKEYNDDNTYNLVDNDSLVTESTNEDDTVDVKMFWTIAKAMVISECGDRTQFSAMSMSAIFDYYGVLIGSSLALFTTVMLGVFLGKKLIKYLHEGVLNFMLGLILCGFAIQIYMGK